MRSGTVEQGALLAGRYRIGTLVGRGGMAEVHEAHDERLDRDVAVKVLRPDLAARADVRGRFEIEARSAARLAHPNVVAVFDTGEEDDVPFLVMERLPGDTLGDRIERGPVDPGWLRGVAVEILSALGAAHRAGIVHRDVKPANILLTDDGRAKVADFGIAKSAEMAAAGSVELTGTNQLLGTPAYLAPERIDGDEASPRSDIYAVGVVLYEALTGSKPFTGATPVAIADAARSQTPPPIRELRPEVDPTFAAVVERAMSRDPAARFASADEMVDALRARNLDDTQVVAPADPTLMFSRPTLAPPVAAAAPAAATSGPHRRRPDVPPSRRTAGGRSSPATRWAPVVVLATLLLLGLVLVSSMGDDGAGSAAGAGETPLSAELRSVAERLDVGDGDGGRAVADGLRTVAEAVEQGDGGDEATEVLALVGRLRAEGRLGVEATRIAREVLLRVPGVDPAAFDAQAPEAAPAEDEKAESEDEGKDGGGEEGDRKGNGRGKGKDD